MGIYDRDYMRDDYVPGNRRGTKPPKRGSGIGFPHMVIGLVLLGMGALFVMSFREGNSGFSTDSEPVVKVDYPLDLNTATFEELTTVPQIGPATADQIIKLRPFGKLEDLLEIYGIGEAKLKVFSQYLKVEPPQAPAKEPTETEAGSGQ